MSSLSVLEMAVEAGPLIHQRYDGMDLCDYLSMLADNSFLFNGSDGVQLQVHHLLPVDWKPTSQLLTVSFDSVAYTIIGTHHTIRNRPVYKLNDGSILVVSDPTTTSINYELTDHSFADPQHEITGENRFLRLVINDQDFASRGANLSMIRDKGVKRPANAFILFRTENMSAIRAQYPGTGNNDISKILGKMWQDSTDEAKDVYKARARQLAASHKLINPTYKYTPRRSHEIARRACANKGPSARADLHRAGVSKRGNKRVSAHLGALTERFASQPSASTLGDIIEEAERVLKSFGLVN